MLLTRSQAASYLAENLPSKSAPQWQTFLNDNAKNRNSPKIRFKSSCGVGGKSYYEELDLMIFIEGKTLPPRPTSHAAMLMEAYGMQHDENITSAGRALGWRNSKIDPILLTTDMADDGVVMQLLINTGRQENNTDSLKALALTLDEAKSLAYDILNALAVIDPSKDGRQST